MIKTCIKCKKEWECDGECKIANRSCCCGDCIVSKGNFGSLEAYKKRLIVDNQNLRAFCCSRFGTCKEKVVFT